MHEEKEKNSFRLVVTCFIIAAAVALIMGLILRPVVRAHAASPEDATLTDARERLPALQEAAASVATSSDATPTDVDKSPYLTNNVSPLQTNDYLLSIRNVLVCIWGSIIFIWSYDRLKAVICRLGGVKKNE